MDNRTDGIDFYIVGLGILTFIILYPAGNLSSTDAYFFGASASTESGLNVEDVNNLYLYQQLALYFIPILGNMQVVSIFIVIFRFVWFRQRLKSKAATIKERRDNIQTKAGTSDLAGRTGNTTFPRAHSWNANARDGRNTGTKPLDDLTKADLKAVRPQTSTQSLIVDPDNSRALENGNKSGVIAPSIHNEKPSLSSAHSFSTRIRFAPETLMARQQPQLDQDISSDNAYPYELDEKRGRDYDPDNGFPEVGVKRARSSEGFEASVRLRSHRGVSRSRERTRTPDRFTLQRVVTNMFELGGGVDPVPVRQRRAQTENMNMKRIPSRESSSSRRARRRASKLQKLKLSTDAVLGRNSNFSNLTSEDKDRLGGVEYRSLKLLVKIVVSYYVSLHLIGIICLTPWIYLTQEPKYRDYLSEKGINFTWW